MTLTATTISLSYSRGTNLFLMLFVDPQLINNELQDLDNT